MCGADRVSASGRLGLWRTSRTRRFTGAAADVHRRVTSGTCWPSRWVRAGRAGGCERAGRGALLHREGLDTSLISACR